MRDLTLRVWGGRKKEGSQMEQVIADPASSWPHGKRSEREDSHHLS